ncbi:MAG: MarR family transcriptional regulator [Verrucomicrobia bacterium]|nr:MarR family transcriptional regulator [Verrucomicrobiota bacterium]
MAPVPPSPPASNPSPATEFTLAIQTLLTFARQRDGLNEAGCRTLLDFMETSGVLGARLRADLAAEDLTRIKFALLLVLFALDPVAVSPSDLALHTGISRPAVSTALEGLAHRRLVNRTGGAADRRLRYVSLTVAGRDLVDRAAMRCLRSLSQIAQPLTDVAHPALREACGLIRAATANAASPDSSP